MGYKAMTDDNDWSSLIRQKINNLYTRYFDVDVILKKDYMDLLKTSKTLYYRWLKGVKMNANEITSVIEDSIYKANELKSMYQKQKMNLSWNEYKEVIENFLQKIFNNCKLIDEYEKLNLTNKYIYDFINEDNFYISYICDSLESYMLNYQKEYYGLQRGRNKQYKRCERCGDLIEKTNNRVKYCKKCAVEINREKTRLNMNNKRKQNV